MAGNKVLDTVEGMKSIKEQMWELKHRLGGYGACMLTSRLLGHAKKKKKYKKAQL